jgi:HEAT repeat protein
VRYDDHALRCELQIANCKLRIAKCGLTFCGAQFAIGILQFAICNPAQSTIAAASPPNEPHIGTSSATERRYDGLTLEEWRRRIPNLDFSSSEIVGAVPGLLAIVQDTEAPWFSRRQAAVTLGRIGKPAQSAVPVLIELLDEPGVVPEEGAPIWSLKALALFGPLAAEATPPLIEILRDDCANDQARLGALEALGRIGPSRAEVLPAIIATLESVDRGRDGLGWSADLERRVAAAEILELFGGHAAPAVPALIRATRDESLLLRRAAANTLGLIGRVAEPAASELVDLVLFDEQEEVRDLAARALARIGGTAEQALARLLADREASVRERAARALTQLTSAAPETVAALQGACDDPSGMVRVACLDALWRITKDPAFVLDRVVDELSSEDREVRVRAVRLLESMGRAARPVIARLRRLDKEGPPHAQQAARRALRSVEPSAQ